MNEIKWIKITTDIFDDEKIKLIDSMPERDTILVIWLKLLTLAGKSNKSGYLLFSDNIPYDEEMLSTLFNRPINSIRLAIGTFKKFGMITVEHFQEDSEKEIFYISNWEKHQNVEGMEKLKIQWKEASKRYRENKKLEHHKTSYDGTYDIIEQNKNKNKNIDIRSLPLTPSKKGEKNERDFFIKIKNLKTFKTYNNNKLLEHLAENYKELALEEAEKIDKKEREKFDDEPKIKDPGAYLLTALKNIKQNVLHT
jgi:predicted phage replisome organizer